MTDQTPSASLYLQSASPRGDELPPLLRNTTRSGSSEIDPLLAGLIVEKSYSLDAATRGGPPGEKVGIAAEANRVLALEAEDGTTIFIHPDQLNADVARLQPEAMVDGAVDLERFRDPNAANRGFGDVIWKAISVLRLPADGLAEEAMALARDWAIEQAEEALGEPLKGKLLDTATFLGAKALMWKIESRLAGRPGLYRWQAKTIAAADYCPPDAPALDAARAGQPMLLLIHGTGSYTVGGFADLRADETTWKALGERFPGGIFGYEHRTFSQSPQENAIEVLKALPPGARVSILSHSRGGLVGDLLCLGQVGATAIDAYRIGTADATDLAGLEREAAEERDRLRQIVKLIGERRITVERYVRVACPARGTRFLSDNLDVALSDFLNLMKWGGGALVGVAAAALGGPAAGESFGRGASSAFGVVNRLVLEIAGRRIDPRMIPGIAAMCVDSPLAAFLAHPETRRRDGIAMAVIAGDTEFSGLGLNNLGRRVANLFCDWRLFDDYDNDLVVDTDSMYAGLGFQPGTGYLYDQGETVTHFRYFFNQSTRDAVHAWLADDPARLTRFDILAAADQEPWKERDRRRVQRGGERQPQPVVILLPGIMGSHIAIRDKRPKDIDRIWFNVFRLGFGQLSRIADIADPQAYAEDIWERIYGDLADYLGATHDVVRCPYDWRQPVGLCADALNERIASAMRDNPGQPVRLLAHSMGGLVARCLMQKYPETWQAVVASGGRLVMLGTPNNGAHLMVHTLLGKTSSMRGLEKLDTQHDLQEVLDIVAGFPGALTLLPRPAWTDVGSDPRLPTEQYYLADTWQDLRSCNTDRWYGDKIGALPSAEFLGLAKAFWEFLPRNEVPDPERVCYVYGQGEKTPCGVVKTADGRLQLLFTSEGDGSVTWASGRLDNLPDAERGWYMPIEHGDLASVEEHFPAILDLITRGTTDQLERLPQTRGAAAATFVLDAPPPVFPSEDELARALIGSAPRRRPRLPRAGLAVSVLAGDLRFVDQPVICGHYIGDPIAAAEAILDKELDGRLSERERLGVYAGEIGSAAIVLPPRSADQSARYSRPGAIIVGLGDFNGQLGARQISETVRTAVLRLLLLLRDTSALGSETPIRLYSLLLGGNSTAHISVDESVAAVTCGVLEANNQFAQVVAKSEFPGMPVATLTFIDIYRDVAITAAHAVAELPRTLASQLRALNADLDVARSLEIGKGVRERLAARSGQGYWSRLIITDADALDIKAPAESSEAPGRSPAPPARSASDADNTANPPPDATPSETRHLPERLKYVFLSQRARAETLVQQRQPGLIEAIIRKQRLTNTPNPQLGQTLFQLMVPVDYKSAARESPRLLLILDSYTASLPWELLQADEEPLAIRTPMVRQLITARYRGMVPTANSNSACIIVAPSTYGYHRRFGGKTEALAELPGAIREGEAIRDKLREARWSNIVCGPDGREAIDVLADLYHAPYRLLAICGHGIFEARGVDGRSYSGVVLSDGLLITAVEIGLMEVVPEVVFLSCCHLGSMSHESAQPNRLAYSLARELIDIGVRCVVAAGWAVDDAAAETFATAFFDKLTTGDTFGDAVFAARVATYDQHRATNTWGAYQAYGDPAYRLGPPDGRRAESNRRYMAVEELLDQLENRRVSHATRAGRHEAAGFAGDAAWVRRELARCPPEWARQPEVLQALGQLYAELGDAGFEPAREAYLAALQSDDTAGRVGCRVIEQLANLEARCGEKLISQGRPAEGLGLLESAARRLLALDAAVDGLVAHKNPERAALLGSTLKRQAAAQARLGKAGWKAIAATLDTAAAAYRKAGGESAADSYNTLNALTCAWLAGHLPITPEEGAELARCCGEEASRRFAASKSFWDAVGSPDAAVVAWLLSGKTTDPEEKLGIAYRQLAREVPHTAREWDSVATQLQLLARFLELRQQAGDAERAALLKRLADPEAAPPTAETPRGRRRAPARKKAD